MNMIRNSILEAMLKNKNGYISGASLGSLFGISRAAVWKHINLLRKDGYEITARPRYGYRLDSLPVRLDYKRFDRKMIRYYTTVDSTNLTIHQLAAEGAPAFTTAVAEEQRQGRGRRGRNWFSPPESGLWFSFLLRPQSLSPEDASAITLVTAAVLADSLNKRYKLPVKVKWPNDLLINGKKVCGILAELRGDLQQIEYLVIGIGLNVNQIISDFPFELQQLATSLSIESGDNINRTDLFLALRSDLDSAYRLFLEDRFMPFHQLWKNYNTTLGKAVTINSAGGTISGQALDLTSQGALRILDNMGSIHIINYGEIL
jgi:BirA family transcriptional regulator, biotin operon repressor / biotin---[acetyl-CoA-carboxylase] ligase